MKRICNRKAARKKKSNNKKEKRKFEIKKDTQSAVNRNLNKLLICWF